MENEEKLRLQHLICYGNYKDEISDNTETFRIDTALFNAFQLLEDETVWSGVEIENKLYERIKLLIAYEVEIKNNKWVSVKDKEVPKDGKCYHVFMAGNQQDFVTYVTNDNGKEPYFRDYFYKEDVTNSILFWRTLPDAPISTTEA